MTASAKTSAGSIGVLLLTGDHLPHPVCGGLDVSKAVMAPHVGRKGNQQPLAAAPAADQHAVASPANSSSGYHGFIRASITTGP